MHSACSDCGSGSVVSIVSGKRFYNEDTSQDEDGQNGIKKIKKQKKLLFHFEFGRVDIGIDSKYVCMCEEF